MFRLKPRHSGDQTTHETCVCSRKLLQKLVAVLRPKVWGHNRPSSISVTPNLPLPMDQSLTRLQLTPASQLKLFNQQQFSGLPSSLSKWSLVWDWAQIEIWKFNKNLIKALMIVCYIRDLCFKNWSILVRPRSTGQEEGIKIQTVRSNDHYDKKDLR